MKSLPQISAFSAPHLLMREVLLRKEQHQSLKIKKKRRGEGALGSCSTKVARKIILGTIS